MTPTDLMAKIREEAEKKYGEYGDAEPNINCWMAGAEFLLTELSRATEGHEECDAGCVVFTGGDRRHTTTCPHYPGSINKMLDDARAELLAAKAAHAAEVEPLIDRFETAMEENALGDKRILAEREKVAKLREALELIAAPIRADGTYNRGREACEMLACEALAETEDK